MKKLMLLAVMAGLVVWTVPQGAEAQVSDAISLTNQAIKELADYPGRGARETAYTNPGDFLKNWGADVGQIKKATGTFQEALTKAKAANVSKEAIAKLEMAIAYGNATMHKEARLTGLGALYYLCKQNNGEPKDVCEKVPKFGSYVAP